MVTSLSKIPNILLAPVRAFPVSFLFLTLALILPDTAAEVKAHWILSNPLFFIARLLLCSSISYLLVTIAHIVSKLNTKAGTLLIAIFHICIYAVVFTDIFLYKFFGSHINVYMLQLANETTSQESSEFINTYIQTHTFLRIFIKFILFVGAEIIVYKLWGYLKTKRTTNVRRTISSKFKTVLSSLLSNDECSSKNCTKD